MDDLISRQAVNKIIDKWLSNPDYELKDHIYEMTKKIHELPSVEIKEEWIPVSERLPEEAGRYLCTVGASYRNPREMYYAPQEWADESDQTKWRSTDGSYVYDWFVIAWMPLPSPWKGE